VPGAGGGKSAAVSIRVCVLSAITVAELAVGIRRSTRPTAQRQPVEAFPNLFETVPWDLQAASHYGEALTAGAVAAGVGQAGSWPASTVEQVPPLAVVQNRLRVYGLAVSGAVKVPVRALVPAVSVVGPKEARVTPVVSEVAWRVQLAAPFSVTDAMNE
jgi:hypothetical protein